MIPGNASEHRAEILGAGVAGDVGIALRVQSDAVAFVFSEKRQGIERVDVADSSAVRVKAGGEDVDAMLRRGGPASAGKLVPGSVSGHGRPALGVQGHTCALILGVAAEIGAVDPWNATLARPRHCRTRWSIGLVTRTWVSKKRFILGSLGPGSYTSPFVETTLTLLKSFPGWCKRAVTAPAIHVLQFGGASTVLRASDNLVRANCALST